MVPLLHGKTPWGFSHPGKIFPMRGKLYPSVSKLNNPQIWPAAESMCVCVVGDHPVRVRPDSQCGSLYGLVHFNDRIIFRLACGEGAAGSDLNSSS